MNGQVLLGGDASPKQYNFFYWRGAVDFGARDLAYDEHISVSADVINAMPPEVFEPENLQYLPFCSTVVTTDTHRSPLIANLKGPHLRPVIEDGDVEATTSSPAHALAPPPALPVTGKRKARVGPKARTQGTVGF